MKVRDAMTSDVVSASTTTPFRRIVELMTSNHVSGLPVVDGLGHVIGVVSEGDLVVKEHRGSPVRLRAGLPSARKRREYARRVEGAVAGELMSAPAITVDADADLRFAARLLSLHSIRRVPVTQAGKLCGVLSRADVLKVFLRPDEDIRREIVDDILGNRIVANVPNVLVEVADGIVTLSGDVRRRSTALVIGFHVDRVDGVTRVDNELHYELDDMEIEPQLAPPMGPAELRL